MNQATPISATDPSQAAHDVLAIAGASWAANRVQAPLEGPQAAAAAAHRADIRGVRAVKGECAPQERH